MTEQKRQIYKWLRVNS